MNWFQWRKYRATAKELTSLLADLQHREMPPSCAELPGRILQSVELVAYNEAGIAFENLCENLYEYNFPLAQEDYARIERIGRCFEYPAKTWDFLARLVKK